MTRALAPELVAALTAVDTPTICNAIELVCGRRRADGFTRIPVVCAHPAMKPMLGFAKTATIRADAPSTRPAAEQKAVRVGYYRYVAAGPGPRLVVIADLSAEKGIGAFWGEVNTAIHRGLGLEGVLTDGSIRDLDVVAPGFQLLAGCVSPSHAHVRVESFDTPVTVFGLTIAPGDLVHADRHGAVIIETGVEAELPRAIDLSMRQEKPILDAARAPGFDVEKLIAAWGAADDVH